ncbi:MAG: hypothetical protein N2235_02520, partial [Fischerella sp.]|nr:hypothetical protein [Fischerella sp.]
AVVIGNGITRLGFDLKYIANHRGGLNGTERLQSYGCNALYRDFSPDFLVVTGDEIVAEVAASGYCDHHIVYARAPHLMEYPGKFYLIPQNPSYNAGSIAAYLAAFDGHRKIFLLGFDGQDTKNHNYNVYAGTNAYQTAWNAQTDQKFWFDTLRYIMRLYRDVEFIRVMPTEYAREPDQLRDCLNYRQIDFNQFVKEADIG